MLAGLVSYFFFRFGFHFFLFIVAWEVDSSVQLIKKRAIALFKLNGQMTTVKVK